MTRIFGYCRVSTTDQTVENQILEISQAGFKIEPRRIVSETVSGSVAANQRKEFAKLKDRLETGDILVVTKIDRLGRDALDVNTTIKQLESIGVKVHCLALGGTDLTSAAGQMIMQIVAAFAQFERDLLIERTRAGLKRAKAEGKKLGRPAALTDAQKIEARRRRAEPDTKDNVSSLAREFKVKRQTMQRALKDPSI
jgi:putative DNA-invertase from lambdoid prophage Rac